MEVVTPLLVRSPASNKKRQGMPPQKGTNASKTLALPAVPPSPSKTGCRERSLRTAKKKEGSLLPPKKTHSPLPKKVEWMFVTLWTYCHP